MYSSTYEKGKEPPTHSKLSVVVINAGRFLSCVHVTDRVPVHMCEGQGSTLTISPALFVCLAYAFVCVGVCASAHVCIWRPEIKALGLSLSISSLLFETGSLAEPGAGQFSGVTGLLRSSCIRLFGAGIIDMCRCTQFIMWVLGSESGPPACETSTSLI